MQELEFLTIKMKPWTREQTKHWIAQLESRISDIDHFLKKTLDWCENRFIYDDRQVFMFSFLTVIWVSHMRDEPISYIELLEILGIPEMIVGEDKTYDLGPELSNISHEQLLDLIYKGLNKGDNYLPS